MNWLSWLPAPSPRPKDVDQLVDRFTRARWIDAALVTNAPLEIIWSEKGRDRLAKIVPVMVKLVPTMFDPKAKRCGQFAGVRYGWQLHKLTAELRPPELSRLERAALHGMIVLIGQRHRGDKQIAKWFKTRIG